MEATTQVTRGARASSSSARQRSLDDLSRLDVAKLGELYARGTTPARLGVLEGHPRGRMLSVRSLDHGLPGRVLRQIAGAATFPWGGKSFAGNGETGSRKKAAAPARAMPTVSSTVAMGRRMKAAEKFTAPRDRCRERPRTSGRRIHPFWGCRACRGGGQAGRTADRSPAW